MIVAQFLYAVFLLLVWVLWPAITVILLCGVLCGVVFLWALRAGWKGMCQLFPDMRAWRPPAAPIEVFHLHTLRGLHHPRAGQLGFELREACRYLATYITGKTPHVARRRRRP